MTDGKPVSRRNFLAATGAAVLGGCTSSPGNPVFSVEIALTEGLARQSREEKGYSSYPADVMAGFARRSLGPILPGRVEIEVVHSSQEPAIGGETVEDVLEEWKEVSRSDHSSKLLITDGRYPDAVGVAETVSDPLESSCAVLGEGYDLLELDPDEQREQVLVREYVEDELVHELNFDPFKTVIVGEHEIGHNAGLGHDDGEVYGQEDDVTLSTMAASHPELHMDSSDAYFSDIYWEPGFSSSAAEKMDQLV